MDDHANHNNASGTPPRSLRVERAAKRLAGGASDSESRLIPSEVPVSLTYNGLSHVVMMVTPADLKEFVMGFSLTEGIIDAGDQLLDLTTQETEQGILLNAQIPDDHYKDLIARRRNIVGQTGCGLCGLIELEAVARPLPEVTQAPTVNIKVAHDAARELSAWQPLNAETGAVHAAAFADGSGRILEACEDVGRHNALDKLIGVLAMKGIDPQSGFVVLSSRCSYELVQKAMAAHIPALVTISAPTELAVELAQRGRLTLVALAREDSMLCFNDPFDVFA